MSTHLPANTLIRAAPRPPAPLLGQAHVQVRRASLLRRPLRPYTFTQLLTLSDGSTSVQRTTSPIPLYRTTKDTRNHPLWNPSSAKLANVEEDEAGRLKAFRAKFGRGWDAEALEEEEGNDAAHDGTAEGEEGLLDLISGFGKNPTEAPQGGAESKGKGSKKGS
ncbi:MAG: hypothetical protein M1832_002236 [Thelocarpon impressellum]|nr:MAG: hypothetical protein M1832_002236 [Thelocarpon impressellum]